MTTPAPPTASPANPGYGICAHCNTGIEFVRLVGWMHSGYAADHAATPRTSWTVGDGTYLSTYCTAFTGTGGGQAHGGPCPVHSGGEQ